MFRILLKITVKTCCRGDGGFVMELLEGKKSVGCKCLFTVKHKVDGSLKRDKAQLIGQEYKQSYIIYF